MANALGNFVNPLKNQNWSQILGTVAVLLGTALMIVKIVASVLAPDVAEKIPDMPIPAQ